MSVDTALLSANLVRPARPRLAEARAAVGGAADGNEAWRRLHGAGLVPPALFAASDRRFAVVDVQADLPSANAEGVAFTAAPSSVDAAIALAADAEGVLEAERLGRIQRERLVPWGAPEPTGVDWLVLTHLVGFNFEQGPIFNRALYSLEYALEEVGIDIRTLRPEMPWLPEGVNEVIRARDAWRIAIQEALEVPRAHGAPSAIVDTPFSSLRDPFEPALALWDRGYVLDHLTYDNSPRIRLFTLVVDSPEADPRRRLAARLARLR
jgi:hypothetical protein